MKIGFVTCHDLSRYFPSNDRPLLTHDDAVCAEALEERGHEVVPVVWDRETPGGLDLLVVRSTWDYMDSPSIRRRFVERLKSWKRAGARVENPVDLILWNLDKRYLFDLEGAGVPIVPTRIVEKGEEIRLEEIFKELGPFVLKPNMSAAGCDTYRVDTREEAQSFDFEARRDERATLIQPFLETVLTEGEWSLVFIDGKYVHAVRKRPARGNWLVQDERGGSVFSETPPEAVVACACAGARGIAEASGCLPEGRFPLYARVDVLDEGAPKIAEVELIEPELFFLERKPGGPVRSESTIEAFCAAVEERG